jgi:uncharacterized protein YycO
VREIGIYDFLMGKEKALCLRAEESSPDQRAKAADTAKSFVGLPYDDDLLIPTKGRANKKFYCSELAYWVHKTANPDLPFDLRTVWGVPTIIPDDFIDAPCWQEVLRLA